MNSFTEFIQGTKVEWLCSATDNGVLVKLDKQMSVNLISKNISI
jgi:hypothetical protein